MAPVAIPGIAERQYVDGFPEGVEDGIPQGLTHNKSGKPFEGKEAVEKFLAGERVEPAGKEPVQTPAPKPPKQEAEPPVEEPPPGEGEESPAPEAEIEVDGVKMKAADVKAALDLKKSLDETTELKRRLAADPALRALVKATLQEVEPPPPAPEKEPELPAEVAEALGGDEKVVGFFKDQLKKTRDVERRLHDTQAQMYANQFKESLRELADAHGIAMPEVEEARAIGQGVLMGDSIIDAFKVKMGKKIEEAKVKAEDKRKRDAANGAGEPGTHSPPPSKKTAPPIPGDFKKSLEKEGLDWNKIHESDLRRQAARS